MNQQVHDEQSKGDVTSSNGAGMGMNFRAVAMATYIFPSTPAMTSMPLPCMMSMSPHVNRSIIVTARQFNSTAIGVSNNSIMHTRQDVLTQKTPHRMPANTIITKSIRGVVTTKFVRTVSRASDSASFTGRAYENLLPMYSSSITILLVLCS